jgi:hypothetical protein
MRHGKLKSIKPPLQRVPGALSLGTKLSGREANHPPPASAEVKKYVELYLHLQYAFMAWCLVKHRDNFTFTFEGKMVFSGMFTQSYMNMRQQIRKLLRKERHKYVWYRENFPLWNKKCYLTKVLLIKIFLMDTLSATDISDPVSPIDRLDCHSAMLYKISVVMAGVNKRWIGRSCRTMDSIFEKSPLTQCFSNCESSVTAYTQKYFKRCKTEAEFSCCIMFMNVLWAGWSGFYGSIPGEGWEFFSSPPRPERMWVPPSLLSNGYQWLFPSG